MSEPQMDLDKLRAKTDDTIKNYEDFPPVNDWELEAQRSALIVRALLQRVADADAEIERLTIDKKSGWYATVTREHAHQRDVEIPDLTERLAQYADLERAARDKRRISAEQHAHLEMPAVNDPERDAIKELACGCELPMYPEIDTEFCAAYKELQEAYGEAHDRENAALRALGGEPNDR